MLSPIKSKFLAVPEKRICVNKQIFCNFFQIMKSKISCWRSGDFRMKSPLFLTYDFIRKNILLRTLSNNPIKNI